MPEENPHTDGGYVAPAPPPQSPANRRPKRRSFWREALSSIAILLSAFLVALLLITYVFQSYVVDGPSMQETLHDNDRLIVWKAPRTWATITGGHFIPSRGDIIVFNENGLSQFGQAGEKQLVKRVIGLPGDRVVVNNGRITIYNQRHPNGFNPDKALDYFADDRIPFTGGHIDVTLSSNHLFVAGDNRSNSLDSRAFGPIDADQIVGELVLRVLPLSDAKAF